MSVQLVSKISNLCDPDAVHQRHRQTDRRTSCNLNTALCTSVSRGKNENNHNNNDDNKEVLGLTTKDNRRPDSLTLLPWSREKPTAWDVTIQDTFADSRIDPNSFQAGSAANNAVQRQGYQLV